MSLRSSSTFALSDRMSFLLTRHHLFLAQFFMQLAYTSAASIPSATTGASCIDESGAAVDFWFMYKHPRWADKSHKVCIGNCDGDTYVYVTSETLELDGATPSWRQGGSPVTETTSLLGKTLSGVYDGSITNYVFYNDQLPDGSYSTTYGHSKGFFGFGGDSAFWVQVPPTH